jgi:hypothetical protein
MVGVQVRGRAPGERDEALELGLDLGLDLLGLGSGRRPARVANEAAVGVDQRGRAGQRLPEREVEVDAQPQAGIEGAASWSRSTSAVTSTVVLVTIPWRWASKIPALTPGVMPKSSALTISRRSMAGYPG